jgi:hypothetical protein
MDLTPFIFALQVFCGYFAIVFVVLSCIPGATDRHIG